MVRPKKTRLMTLLDAGDGRSPLNAVYAGGEGELVKVLLLLLELKSEKGRQRIIDRIFATLST